MEYVQVTLEYLGEEISSVFMRSLEFKRGNGWNFKNFLAFVVKLLL